MAKRINAKQVGRPIFAGGSIVPNTANGVKALTETARSGIAYDGSGTYTVQTKGIYYIQVSQLIRMGASAMYLNIQINGTTVSYGYNTGNIMLDIQSSHIGELNVGDTIRFSYQNAATEVWGGPHSNYQIFMLGAT